MQSKLSICACVMHIYINQAIFFLNTTSALSTTTKILTQTTSDSMCIYIPPTPRRKTRQTPFIVPDGIVFHVKVLVCVCLWQAKNRLLVTYARQQGAHYTRTGCHNGICSRSFVARRRRLWCARGPAHILSPS